MTRSSDNQNVDLRSDLDDRAVDALLSGHPVVDVAQQALLSGFVAELRTLAHTPAPAPSSALAALLEDGLSAATLVLPAALPSQRSSTWTRLRAAVSWRTTSEVAGPPATSARRTWALPLQLSLAAAGALALLLGAAAAKQLPDPVQTAVADVVEALTPLDVPRPSEETSKPDVPEAPAADVDDTTGPEAREDDHGPSDADKQRDHGNDPVDQRHEGERSDRGKDAEGDSATDSRGNESSSPEPRETSTGDSSAPESSDGSKSDTSGSGSSAPEAPGSGADGSAG